MTPFIWQCREHRFEIGLRPLVMGILNVTPDSFSDGARYFDPAAAVERGLQLVADGADILDVGGESTRPGATIVPVEEELRRVLPVVRDLAERIPTPISVDTMKAEVARQCLDAGACIINDVTGLHGDPAMPAVAAQSGAGVVVMHMQGTPATMHLNPIYDDVVHEVGEFFEERLRTLAGLGIRPEAVCLDPGIGFGKNQEHSLALLAHLDRFMRWGRPVCLGVSRKGFIGLICGRERAERMAGSLAAACIASARGSAQVLRVHDVGPTRDMARMLEAIDQHRRGPS